MDKMKRQASVVELIEGFFLVFEAIQHGSDIAAIEAQLLGLFGMNDDAWWTSTTRCRVHFQTKGGGDETFWVYNKSSTQEIGKAMEK